MSSVVNWRSAGSAIGSRSVSESVGAKSVAVMAAALAVFGLVVTASPAFAGIPRTINYQGRIMDGATGEPLAGSHDVLFSLYDAPAGGDTLWTESQAVVADSSGVFSCLLGSVKAIAPSFGGQRWLEVQVDGEILHPRREMASVPYAFLAQDALSAEHSDHASDADSLEGHTAVDFVVRGEAGSVTAEMVAGGAGSGLDADLLDGLNSDAFADTSHNHDERYYTETELKTAGTINQTSNPVDWTKLKGVPAGFADGTDDTGAADRNSLDAADGNPTDAVYVDDVGDVGIGTTSPARKLHISGEGPRILIEGTAGSPELNFKLGGDGLGDVWALYKESITGDLRFFQNGDRVTIEDGTGEVGIGTSSPKHALDVNGDINAASVYAIGDTTVLSIWPDDILLVGPGAGAGSDISSFDGSVAVGSYAGYAASGHANTFVGFQSGYTSGDGSLGNTFIGNRAGSGGNKDDHNTFLGSLAGQTHVNGQDNTFVGEGAGSHHTDGSYNTMIGCRAGESTVSGSGNVFLGYNAGRFEGGSNKLYIANDMGSEDVLIYGDFAEGRVGIGTVEPRAACRLHVDNPSSSDTARAIYGVASSVGTPSHRAGVYGETKCSGSGAYGTGVYGHASGEAGFSAGVRGVTDAIQGFGVVGQAAHTSGTNVGVYGGTDSPNGWAGVFVGGKSYFGGDVGIGTTFPERKLHILGDGPRILIESTGGNPEINLENTDDTSAERWAIYKHSADDGLRFYQNGDRVTFESGTGNVGIGTDEPAGYRLYVNGQAYATLGWQSSDLRLKTDLCGIDDALAKVLRLSGHSFRWRTEDYPERGFPEGRHYGLIAQEVEEVLPEAVGNGPGDEKALAYSELIPVLVESIKELKAETDQLRAENTALRERVDALERD